MATLPRKKSAIPNPVAWPLKLVVKRGITSEYEFVHHIDDLPATKGQLVVPAKHAEIIIAREDGGSGRSRCAGAKTGATKLIAAGTQAPNGR